MKFLIGKSVKDTEGAVITIVRRKILFRSTD